MKESFKRLGRKFEYASKYYSIRDRGLFLTAIDGWTLILGKFKPVSDRCKIKQIKKKVVQKKLKKFFSEFTPHPQPFEKKGEALEIWVLWLQGMEAMPEIVKLCYDSILLHSSGHEVILLNEENIAEYVSIPPVIIERYRNGDISRTFLSDMIRICLLEEYGGLWLDSTLFLPSDLSETIFGNNLFAIKNRPGCYLPSFCLFAGKKEQWLFHNLKRMFVLWFTTHAKQLDYDMIDYFVGYLYQNCQECKSEIDLVPQKDSDVFALLHTVFDEYDETVFNGLCKNNDFFKLTYKIYREGGQQSARKTYFQHLCEMTYSKHRVS